VQASADDEVKKEEELADTGTEAVVAMETSSSDIEPPGLEETDGHAPA